MNLWSLSIQARLHDLVKSPLFLLNTQTHETEQNTQTQRHRPKEQNYRKFSNRGATPYRGAPSPF